MNELQRYYLEKADPSESERQRRMSLLEAYLANTQYACLPAAWDESVNAQTGEVIPFRLRRPSTVVPLPSLIVDTFTRALWAVGRRPVATINGAEGDADNVLLSSLIDEAKIYRTMREATRRALAVGAGAVVWKLEDDHFATESWDPKWCIPTFRPHRFPELERLEYKHPYTVEEDGKPITRWHREVIDAQSWKIYQDAEVTATEQPIWREDSAASFEHGLGFVPAVWFTVGERSGPWDGTGIYAHLLSLFDDANWTASQQARALHYNLDPQTVFIGVKDSDIESLRKGGTNAWQLPTGGDAKLLESNGKYVDSAQTRLESLRKWALDAAAVVINDPERVSGGQSGSALELLSAPMLARISDLREDVGACALQPLLEQMLRKKRSKPGSVVLHWGSPSPTTADDARSAVEAAAKAVDGRMMSRAAAARYVATYTGVADVEADQLRVDAERDDQERAVELAAGAGAVDIPSPTFQALHKARIAALLLGAPPPPAPDASVVTKIQRELELNLTSESLSLMPRRVPLSPPTQTEVRTEDGPTAAAE
jgi:hypothetical protein